MMPYPDDDSCPKCGEANGSGYPCNPCYVRCPECDALHHPEGECVECKVHEFIDQFSKDEMQTVREVICRELFLVKGEIF